MKVAVTGVSGKMGSGLVRHLRLEPDVEIVGGTDRPGSASIGLDVGLAAHGGALECTVRPSLEPILTEQSVDVVIDFTSAQASVDHAAACALSGVPLVVGSTGFSSADKEAIAAAAKTIPVVMSPNMSVGVNLVVEVAAELARRLGDGFDVEVLELHHRRKKDAPSGTALRLAEEVARALGRGFSDIQTMRSGQVGERPEREIGVQSLRGGDVIGEHTIMFLSDGERIELTHRAMNREQFIRGAVRAARWVVGQPPGLYGMADVLSGSMPGRRR